MTRFKTRSCIAIISLSWITLFNPHLLGQGNKVFTPREFKKAVENGTRTNEGVPGKNYFQNQADYTIHAEYNPQTRNLQGNAVITYRNNSQDRLRYIILKLHQNVFLKGGIRGREVDPGDVHDGVKLHKVTINGINFDPEKPFYSTQTNVVYPMDLEPGEQSTIEVDWEFTMPGKTTNRFGCYETGACFIAYWFPQVAVYDDIDGWDISDYTGVAEFYNNYGNFEVNITVPENYIVWAGGELTNAEEILNPPYLRRLNRAKSTERIVQVIGKKDLRNKKSLTKAGSNTWKFKAEAVNDFAFGTSNSYLWDATSVEITDNDGNKRRVLIEAAYDTGSVNFREVAEISAWSVKDFSDDLPGVPYPYPKLTAFNGMGGMEFPMIINNGETGPEATLFLTTHEIGHSYFPFMVGTNQKRHGWIDEGLVTMFAQEQHLKRDTTYNFRDMYLRNYPRIAGTQADVPPLVNSHFITDDIFQIHEYMRPSMAFWTLHEILGHELFRMCLIDFILIWEGKHPTPWDLFNSFEKTTRMKLGWFFEPWFGQFAYPDLKISEAFQDNDSCTVLIKNAGGMPFPARLKLIYENNTEEIHDLPATLWKNSREFTFSHHTSEILKAAMLITEGFPDVDIENNYFELNQQFPGKNK